MAKHSIDVLRQAITFVNPNQVPVITVDQLLFALAKMVLWIRPASHEEQAYVVMLGGLQRGRVTEWALDLESGGRGLKSRSDR